MGGSVGGWEGAWMHGLLGGWMDEWMDGWVGKWVGGKEHGWLGGWMRRKHMFMSSFVLSFRLFVKHINGHHNRKLFLFFF